MSVQPGLEAYLSALDKALGQISVSDRADIITEIKSHVLDAEAKDPTQSIETILSSLGDPNTVAKRYLQERGLHPINPQPATGMNWLAASIKWLVIGFLGFTAMMIVVVGLLIWRFTPLVAVDSVNNRVSIAGGTIQVQDKDVSVTAKKVIEKIQGKNEKVKQF